MTLTHAALDCTVVIYPYEGGRYTLDQDSLRTLGVSVDNPLQAEGTFALNLAPGGPGGPNVAPSWGEIITRMSLVLIGMRRGPYARIVMAGLVDITTDTDVATPRGIQRSTTVQGTDFTKFFNHFSYFNLNLLTGLNSGALGDLGLPTLLNAGLTQGTPEALGAAWFQLMAGPQGILAQTRVPYLSGTALFGDVMSTWFEPYGDEAVIPSGANFLGEQGSWMDKFRSFFPFPWYELFVTTAEPEDYPKASSSLRVLSLPGYPPCTPTLVARRSPLPVLRPPGGTSGGSVSSAGGATQVVVHGSSFTLDQSDWQALDVFEPDSDDDARGFGGRGLYWTEDEIRNFFVLNPTYLSTLFGGSNGNLSAFALSYAAWINVASIHRYGYRPAIMEVAWMADPTGSAAIARHAQGQTEEDFQAFVGRLSLRVVSYYQPTAIMARATITLPLRPDIIAGRTFVWAPWKDGVLWKAYIEGVKHDYAFGGLCATTLTLTRALPLSVYDDASTLRAVHLGNAMQQNGKITKGLPADLGSALQSFNASTAEAISRATAGVFASPNPGG